MLSRISCMACVLLSALFLTTCRPGDGGLDPELFSNAERIDSIRTTFISTGYYSFKERHPLRGLANRLIQRVFTDSITQAAAIEAFDGWADTALYLNLNHAPEGSFLYIDSQNLDELLDEDAYLRSDPERNSPMVFPDQLLHIGMYAGDLLQVNGTQILVQVRPVKASFKDSLGRRGTWSGHAFKPFWANKTNGLVARDVMWVDTYDVEWAIAVHCDDLFTGQVALTDTFETVRYIGTIGDQRKFEIALAP